MTLLFLRWTIGIASTLALVLFLLVLTVGKGLGSSYQSGAATEDFARSALPVAIPLLIGGMLATAIFPNASMLMHGVAVLTVAGLAGCMLVMREHPGEGGLYAGFLAVWLIYYGLVVSGRSMVN